MDASSLVFVGIAPHPPIMIPEVGGAEIEHVRGSIDAMRELTGRVTASRAETVLLVSPHAPLEARAFVAYADAELRGDFRRFRARGADVYAPLDSELLDSITREASADGFSVVPLRGEPLDHGTAVPLYFLLRNGWRGRVVALGYSFLPDEDHVRFGAALRRAVEATGRRVAFVASGDLSHRLTPDAPAGHHPDAHLFDEEVVGSIRDATPGRIAEIDPALRRLAGECGYRSMLVALGASERLGRDCDLLHYEAPFGVGYMVAQLARRSDGDDEADATQDRAKQEQANETVSESAAESAPDDGVSAPDDDVSAHDDDVEKITSLARRAVETYVREGRAVAASEVLPGATPAALAGPAACFVSIKTEEGDLRGCIGTVEPTRARLADELVANAVSAATRDPRFPPVEPHELPRLRYSVDILSEPEAAEFADLDPKIYGVIVEDESGRRRGLLLPDIEGVETASEQVRIAARKAGIQPHESLRLYRFRVTRFRERMGQKSTSE